MDAGGWRHAPSPLAVGFVDISGPHSSTSAFAKVAEVSPLPFPPSKSTLQQSVHPVAPGTRCDGSSVKSDFLSSSARVTPTDFSGLTASALVITSVPAGEVAAAAVASTTTATHAKATSRATDFGAQPAASPAALANLALHKVPIVGASSASGSARALGSPLTLAATRSTATQIVMPKVERPSTSTDGPQLALLLNPLVTAAATAVLSAPYSPTVAPTVMASSPPVAPAAPPTTAGHNGIPSTECAEIAASVGPSSPSAGHGATTGRPVFPYDVNLKGSAPHSAAVSDQNAAISVSSAVSSVGAASGNTLQSSPLVPLDASHPGAGFCRPAALQDLNRVGVQDRRVAVRVGASTVRNAPTLPVTLSGITTTTTNAVLTPEKYQALAYHASPALGKQKSVQSQQQALNFRSANTATTSPTNSCLIITNSSGTSTAPVRGSPLAAYAAQFPTFLRNQSSGASGVAAATTAAVQARVDLENCPTTAHFPILHNFPLGSLSDINASGGKFSDRASASNSSASASTTLAIHRRPLVQVIPTKESGAGAAASASIPAAPATARSLVAATMGVRRTFSRDYVDNGPQGSGPHSAHMASLAQLTGVTVPLNAGTRHHGIASQVSKPILATEVAPHADGPTSATTKFRPVVDFSVVYGGAVGDASMTLGQIHGSSPYGQDMVASVPATATIHTDKVVVSPSGSVPDFAAAAASSAHLTSVDRSDTLQKSVKKHGQSAGRRSEFEEARRALDPAATESYVVAQAATNAAAVDAIAGGAATVCAAATAKIAVVPNVITGVSFDDEGTPDERHLSVDKIGNCFFPLADILTGGIVVSPKEAVGTDLAGQQHAYVGASRTSAVHQFASGGEEPTESEVTEAAMAIARTEAQRAAATITATSKALRADEAIPFADDASKRSEPVSDCSSSFEESSPVISTGVEQDIRDNTVTADKSTVLIGLADSDMPIGGNRAQVKANETKTSAATTAVVALATAVGGEEASIATEISAGDIENTRPTAGNLQAVGLLEVTLRHVDLAPPSDRATRGSVSEPGESIVTAGTTHGGDEGSKTNEGNGEHTDDETSSVDDGGVPDLLRPLGNQREAGAVSDDEGEVTHAGRVIGPSEPGALNVEYAAAMQVTSANDPSARAAASPARVYTTRPDNSRGVAVLKTFLADETVLQVFKSQFEQTLNTALRRQRQRLLRIDHTNDYPARRRELDRTADLLALKLQLEGRDVSGLIEPHHSVTNHHVAGLLREVAEMFLLTVSRGQGLPQSMSLDAEALSWTLLVEALRTGRLDEAPTRNSSLAD